MKRFLLHIVLCILPLSALAQGWAVNPAIKQVRLGGECKKRVENSFGYLQQVALSLVNSVDSCPDDVSHVAEAARVAFALSLEVQALKEKSPALDSLMTALIASLNPQGYWGNPVGNTLDESQLAVNGLLLKALCEYQRQHLADSLKQHIHTLAHNLFTPHLKQLRQYAAGISRPWWQKLLFWKRNGRGWKYADPRGQMLEGMSGLTEACKVLRDSTLAPVVDALAGAVKKSLSKTTTVSPRYQTSALRTLLQWSEVTADHKLAQWVQAQFDDLVKQRLTASFAVADGDSLTSVTATADAFLLANDLWRFSADTRYVELAQLIYFNALCSMQSSHGDFVPLSVPTPTQPHLVAMPQATNESSAQGAEALTQFCRVATAVKADTFYINHFTTEMAGPIIDGHTISMLITSKFPIEENQIEFMLLKQPDGEIAWKIFFPHWLKPTSLKINEQQDSCVIDAQGFLSFSKAFEQYGSVSVAFADTSWCDTPPSLLGKTTMRRIMQGPLLLAHQTDTISTLPLKPSLQKQRAGNWKVKGAKVTLSPINHFLKPNALAPDRKRHQVLFPNP